MKRWARRIPGVRAGYHRLARWYEIRRRRTVPPAQIFTEIYRENRWSGRESVSGPGSDLERTRSLILALPVLLHELGAKSLLDIPCGDFHWMRHVDLTGIQYLGADIVDALIENNQSYAADTIRFCRLDLLADPLPKVDVILCRDCLVHFSYAHIWQALDNLVASGSSYVLTTTFPRHAGNENIPTGDWRPLNLEAAPFHFPEPIRRIVEVDEADPSYSDKSLGLWKLSDVATAIGQSRGLA